MQHHCFMLPINASRHTLATWLQSQSMTRSIMLLWIWYLLATTLGQCEYMFPAYGRATNMILAH